MKIFVSGGCKNGKSHHAQRLARAQRTDSLHYIATMKPVDSEDEERVLKHRREREGWGFTTVEQPVDIEMLLGKCGHDSSFLVDSLTALLANEMFLPGGSVNERAAEKIEGGLLQVLDSVEKIVVVSDYIYSDAHRFDALTEKYRKSLARLDRVAAKACDVVLEVVCANVIVHKGKELYGWFHDKIL
ncbi:MAG: bifunctional adenosylcobinamide kinase/adenosylcobinamide-phosphate guanylyltransferase [Holophagales bacterium]|jgi:adenosylcobinamide kinase/adenosylcobinamide-phosphate guanylyltransferase|nr:bifunctional adenosylcobinamide kinase/adenosylcobinamide-phosphate guanylyltransferase [Holophagales bacterium]